jgi:NAD(P)-dependent dehydrogenase (short-subunit alcohol dehydrogenase family)
MEHQFRSNSLKLRALAIFANYGNLNPPAWAVLAKMGAERHSDQPAQWCGTMGLKKQERYACPILRSSVAELESQRAFVDLAAKVAIITGSGGGGTGRATARRFARDGAAVVVTDKNDTGGHDTVASIEAERGRAAFFHADVSFESDIQALIGFAESRFGELDVLVNNASNPDGMGLLTGCADAIAVEVLGPMRATLAAIEVMRCRGGGAIVNIGSTSALGHGRKHSPWPAYDVGKIAQMRLTTTLACLRDRENIRVNCLVPGWVASPGPKGVLGKPDPGST